MEKSTTTIKLNNTVCSTYLPSDIELTNPNLEFAYHDDNCDEWIGPVHFDRIEDNTLIYVFNDNDLETYISFNPDEFDVDNAQFVVIK